MKPYLVNAIREYGVDIKKIQPTVLEENICSNETLLAIKECLGAVVDSLHGTGHKVLYDTAYKIAGKTGTAVTALDNRGYNKGNKIYQASFMGYFPANDPKYTIAVVIQNSNESKLIYGADVSGTVFKEISDKIFNKYIGKKLYQAPSISDTSMYHYYGFKSELNSIYSNLKLPFIDSANEGLWRQVSIKNNNSILQLPNNTAISTAVPNAVGMGLKDAIYKIETAGLKATTSGRGRVVSQSLPAGTTYKKGQNIILFLN
jgi:cell division protein FtsI (penicillin-binding protein 3)